MFVRALLSLLFLIPTYSWASELPMNCQIGKFLLSLNDFGVDKNYTPEIKSVGNHNPAIILDFIKNVLIKNQAYSLEGQSFTLREFAGLIAIDSNLLANNDNRLRPLIFDSALSGCTGSLNNFVCSESNQSAKLNIILNTDLTSGILTAYLDKKETLLTKHMFSCE